MDSNLVWGLMDNEISSSQLGDLAVGIGCDSDDGREVGLSFADK